MHMLRQQVCADLFSIAAVSHSYAAREHTVVVFMAGMNVKGMPLLQNAFQFACMLQQLQ